MLKAATLFTYEVDDPELAVRELQDQLAEKIVLLKNTVGVLLCDPEFVHSDIVQAISASLPFPLVGATTMAQAINGETGVLLLTIMVLTSDDICFATGFTEPAAAGDDILASLRGAYEDAARRLGVKPAFILVFPPLIPEISGNLYIDALRILCPKTPIFGAMAADDMLTHERCRTIHNGFNSSASTAFVLVGGNVSPRFFVATISENKLLPYGGEITKSHGNVVEEINDVLASKYFESIGLAKDGVLDPGLPFLPFVLDFRKRDDYDGVPVVHELVHLDQNGFAVCRGDMYQNSTFKLGIFESEDILETSRRLIEQLNSQRDAQAIIIFSCLARRMSFGVEPLREFYMINELMNQQTPYMASYAGGEICPTSYTKDSITNRFHNYSLIACVL
jgi:hypothetical protein